MLRSKPQDLPSPACAVLDEILRLRIALLAEDQTLCAEQIARETAGEKPVDEPAPDAVAKLRDELLNGFAAAPATLPSVRPLKQILDRRAAIAGAVETLQKREVRTAAAAVAEVMQASGQDWLSIQRRRCAAYTEVLAAEAAAEQFRVSVAAKTGGMRPSLLGDLGDQPPLTRHALHTLAAIREAGIVQ